MDGRLVVVRDFRGLPGLARVWRDRGAYVDVVREGFNPEREPAVPPIGFPREDVFLYSRELLASGDWGSGEMLPPTLTS
jgi:hypothetical protein